MTREQFHSYFKVAMDKNSQSVAFGGCPAFLPEEIDYWLDQGLYQEISNKFTGNNYLKTSFEGSVKRIHDLENQYVQMLTLLLILKQIQIDVMLLTYSTVTECSLQMQC